MVRVRYSFGSRHTGNLTNITKQRKKFPDIVRDVIRQSDIVLEVLDARFIDETRNHAVEEEITKLSKKIIYVLNKADLVDEESVKKVLKIKPYVFVSCTKRIGGAKLRAQIKRIARDIDLPGNMERVQVGIIGYPNTGKSSLLNLLIGKSSARVGNEAGFTKGLQKVKLTNTILILDTPGVIAHEDYSMKDSQKIAKHAKVGSRSFSNVRDPDFVVQELLNEFSSRKHIESFYGVMSEGDSEIFLERLGKEKAFLKKGGVVDSDKTARLVLKDWQNGLIS